MTQIPSELLLRYFNTAQRRILLLSTMNDIVDDNTLAEAKSKSLDLPLSRHRMRIVEAQLSALDETLEEWEDLQNSKENNDDVIDSCTVSRDSMLQALQRIGAGDFSCLSPTGSAQDPTIRPNHGNACEVTDEDIIGKGEEDICLLLTRVAAQTNEFARQEFARSVLFVEWRNFLHDEHALKLNIEQSAIVKLRGIKDGGIDTGSFLEYFGVMMAAVKLPEVQEFLRHGTADFLRSDIKEKFYNVTTENRLLHIQQMYWSALGWDPAYGVDQLHELSSSRGTKCSKVDVSIRMNANVMQTLERYASTMTEAVTNAYNSDALSGNDDGTTRVVSVSYSEKMIISQQDAHGEGNSVDKIACLLHPSLAAPSGNTIDEHASFQQRIELNAARETSIIQQQIWDEFKNLDDIDRMKRVEDAKIAHEDFLNTVANTPPGIERILLIQQMDSSTQKLLVTYKLWSSQASTFTEGKQ